ILRNHSVQNLELDLPQDDLILLRECTPFVDERTYATVVVEIQRVDPDQLVPDLEVAQVVRTEACGRHPPVLGRRQRTPAPREQFGVTRKGVNHVLPLRVEEILEDEIDV